jgi:hypothetical protein
MSIHGRGYDGFYQRYYIWIHESVRGMGGGRGVSLFAVDERTMRY